MPEVLQAQLNQISQIGVEETPGEMVAATRRLQSMGLPINPQRNVQSFMPPGFKFATTSASTQEWAEGSVGDGGGVAYNEIHYPLASLLSVAEFVEIQRDPWAAATAVEQGDYILADNTIWRAAAAGQTGAAEPDWSTAPSVGDQVADGNLAWTHAGAHVPAFEAVFDISTYDRDDVQTYTVETGDRVSGRTYRAGFGFFTGFTLESSRAGEVTLEGDFLCSAREKHELTAEGVRESALIPATPAHLNVYMDRTPEEIGATQLDGNFTSTLAIADRAQHVWLHGRQYNGPAGRVETPPDATCELVQADGEEVDDMVAALKAGQKRYFRYNFEGPEIAPGVNHLLDWDCAAQIGDSESFDEEDGVYAATVPFQIQHSGDWGRATRVRVVSTLAGL